MEICLKTDLEYKHFGYAKVEGYTNLSSGIPELYNIASCCVKLIIGDDEYGYKENNGENSQIS